MKILVRATNWIGDAILSLPALRAIAGAFPGASVDVLARPWVSELYARETAIRRIVPLIGRPGLRDFKQKWSQAGVLAAERYDLAVIFPNSFESALLPRLAGIPRIVGYNRDGRRILLHQAVPRPRAGEIPVHERYYYLELLHRAGIVAALPEIPEILFEGLETARRNGSRLFAERGITGPVIGVSPGAAFGGAKRWLPERFAAAARAIANERGATVAVFGSTAEQDICKLVAEQARAINLAGATSLRDYLDLTAACRLVLTNDSGAMHVAYASGVPSVTVFGPTRELHTGPVGPAAAIVREPVECAPCMLRECPIDHRCMTGVAADRVIALGLSRC